MNAIARATGRDDHRVAVALGSGLSALAPGMVDGGPIPYREIEGMPVSGVQGHEGALYHGEIEGVPALLFAGRVHLYEGHDPKTVTHWVREAAGAGCEIIMLTNAAGGIKPHLEVGRPCLISDHLNLTGSNPLTGPNDDTVGPRFLDQTEVYSQRLRSVARKLSPGIQEGVYAGLSGPTYETPAEVRMLRTLGADMVGMSTVHEAIQARYLRLEVLGISVISNAAAGMTSRPLSHDEVAAAGEAAATELADLLTKIIAGL